MTKDEALKWVKERNPKHNFNERVINLFECAWERYMYIQNNEDDSGHNFKTQWMDIEIQLLICNENIILWR